MPAQPHPHPHHRPPTALKSRRLFILATAVALACALLVAGPALAGVVFNYFQITAAPTFVVMTWSTASEVDVAGFDVWMNPVAASENAYQPLTFVPAAGGPDLGARYAYTVTAITAGEAYCFRLSERIITGAVGEMLDRCGYGAGVTPTPAAIPTLVPVAPSATPPLAPVATPTPGTKPIPVPEPLTMLLFGAGLAGIGVMVRRRGRT